MSLDKDLIRPILMKEDSPHLLFKELFQLQKEKSASFSIGYIARECSIPSRGYISEFLNGKRSLNEKYWGPFIECFGLKGRMAEIALVLLKLDEEKPGTEEHDQLHHRLYALRKAISNDTGTLPKKLKGLFFAFEVFCAFGLFANEPTRADLRKYFGREMAIEVDYALTALISLELIGHDGERDRFVLKENAIRFNEDDDGMSHLNYLRYAIKDADQHLSKWYKHEHALFESSIISVKKEAYVRFLQKFYEELLVNLRDLESSDAEALIRVNVQIYPVR